MYKQKKKKNVVKRKTERALNFNKKHIFIECLQNMYCFAGFLAFVRKFYHSVTITILTNINHFRGVSFVLQLI